MRVLLAIGAIALSSCDYRSGPLPNRADVIRVEHALAKAPCIGRIADWGRTYQYNMEESDILPRFLSRLDREKIDFDLGRGPRPGGSRVWLRPPYPPLRDIINELSMARGSYDLRSGKLEFRFCEASRNNRS